MEQFEIENNTLIKYNGDEKIVTIPSNIEVIGKEAFMGNTSLYLALFPDSLKEIGSGAFKDCTNLSNVKLPSNTEIVGAEAFSNCTKLFDAELNEGLKYLGPSCFEGCSGLFEVNIPGSIKIIRLQTFLGCTKLKYVNISEGVERINVSAFEECESLENINLPKSLIVIEANVFEDCAKLEYICIPENVTEMDSCIFYECENLKKVDIKTSKMKILPSHTFYNCNSLTEVNIAEGVEVIEWAAFEDCYKLKALTLPSTLTKISRNAFDNCKIEYLKLPHGLKEIGKEAFINNEKLNIEIDEYSIYFSQRDGVIYSKDLETLYLYPATKEDSKFSVPDGVKIIKDGAFSSNYFLEEIYFPDSVTEIGAKAIYDLENLKKFNIPKSVEYFVPGREIQLCSKLSEVYIANKNVGDEVFLYSCSDWPDNQDVNLKVKGICTSYEAFSSHRASCKKAYACGYVYAINNGFEYTEEDHKKFREYIKLNRKSLISYIKEYSEILTYMMNEKLLDLDDVNILLNLDYISKDAELKNELLIYSSEIDDSDSDEKFENQMKIAEDFASSRTLPEEAAVLDWEYTEKENGHIITRYIGNDSNVIIPSYIGDKAVISIDELAFDGNEIIKSVDIPESVKKIGNRAFMNSINLENVILADGLKMIALQAFFYCDKLKSIVIPKSVKYIEKLAFANCSELSGELEFDNEMYIEESAFANCGKITKITLGEEVEEVEEKAFGSCSSLTDIVILCNPEIIEDDAFINCDNIQRVTLNKKYRREATKLMNKLGNKVSYTFID